ncbi:PREDICTED: prostaglandin E synthase 2-like isoform X3 [Nelumbo nucifera]|uniref:Prostaglandin E synthase 2 n=2 Tax=Nelumbo nucifera TaxID=4432 RepID=A0A822YYH5_NELNU|nr:PREDICTED: prostaglandin E synthase 2-like isoform X3 [Nelumbo nucifera]DAD35786.1 TPA_asm: hypothetical protein HUJ06_006426 [Nelumbo nucifera]
MRRAQSLSSYVVGRATLTAHESLAAASSTTAGVQNRLLQVALYNSSSSSAGPSRWFLQSIAACLGRSTRAVSLGLAGAISFSVAASAVIPEVYAKEPLSPEFLPKEVVLYQYEACPFCNKVKAFLDYHHIPYKVVEVNPLSKKEIKWSDYKKVPILTVDGEQLVDSSGNFSFTERLSVKYAGAAAMYFVSKNLKKKYNITDERAALYEAAETWVDALDGRDFLGGSKPNLADLAVFGVLRPIRYLKSGRDMVENTRIGDWYARMEEAVGESSRIKSIEQ